MRAERWQQVKQLVQTVWDRDGSERCALLDEACANDPELRAVAEKLLKSEEKLGAFLMDNVIEFAPSEDLSDDPRTSPAGRRLGQYQLLRRIGSGGMGAVYLGERADGEFCKRVAVKVVNPRLTGRCDLLRRFRAERQVLAGLDHPYIARLFDAGTTDKGDPYLVMEHVDGVRIDTWCDNLGLALCDRLKLFQKVCEAVQYAHDRQVIHRDLKPANILVAADGTPKLLDFGIARVLDPEVTRNTADTNGRGPVTPDYASPEQVRGEPVGPASDVYSLGVLLYRLVTGRLPYTLQGLDEVHMLRTISEMQPVRPSSAVSSAASEARGDSVAGLRRLLSRGPDDIVMKALQKEPERRYSSAKEFSEDVDRFLRDLPVRARKERIFRRSCKFLKRNRVATASAVLGAVVVLVVATGFQLFVSRVADYGPPSLAVLPFENLSGDREQEYFANGMTDALIGELAGIRDLRVISRTSVVAQSGRVRNLRELARTLNVQTIAEGTVLLHGNRVRIAMRLVDANDHPRWGRSYDGELRDVLALQKQVAAAVAEEIHANLTAPEKARLRKLRPVDLGAYDAYLKGRQQYFTGYTEDSLRRAMDWFHKSLALDPGYAPAYAGLAECFYGLSNIYRPPTEVMPKAKAAALKAINLDETLPTPHAMLALIRSLYDFDRSGAEKEFRRALELGPGDAQTHLTYGIHLAGMGRFNEAVAEAELAQRLDPGSPEMSAYLGLHLYLAHRFDEVIAHLTPLAEMNPNYHHPHAFLGLAYEQKKDWAKAAMELERAYELDKQPEALAQLGHVYAVSGRTEAARKILSELKSLSRKRYVSAYDIAILYAGLNQQDEAFSWLQKVDEDRSEFFAAVNVDPRFDVLHSDPRWAAVLRSVGLAPQNSP